MSVLIITAENVEILVQMYFESQQIKDDSTDLTKYMEHWQRKGKMSFDQTVNKNLYEVFWAIRILSNPKYDFDDIEFHARKNPIFNEINPERNMDEKHTNQLGLLRQAIRVYKTEKTAEGGKIKMVELIHAKL